MTTRMTRSDEAEELNEHWTARYSRPVIFVIITLIAAGIYLAMSIPVAVFPATDFPRIVVQVYRLTEFHPSIGPGSRLRSPSKRR